MLKRPPFVDMQNVSSNAERAMKKYMAYCLATIFVLLGHSGNGQSVHAAAQTSARARQIADSICQTRMLCSTTTLELIEEVYYPMTSKKSPKRKKDLYYFSFKVYIKEDIESELNIAIRGDLSIEYISGVPDKKFRFLALRYALARSTLEDCQEQRT